RPEAAGEAVAHRGQREHDHVIERQERPDQDDQADHDQPAFGERLAHEIAETAALAGALPGRRVGLGRDRLHTSVLRPRRRTRRITSGISTGSAVMTVATPMSSWNMRNA